MKVLLSAFWCEPGRGSEPEAGWQVLRAVARDHEVWLLTHATSVAAVRTGLAAEDLAERVQVEGISLGARRDRLQYADPVRFHWYHDRWQRRAGQRARELDGSVDFDVVHHATLAAYWTRAGVAVLDKPLVWGPVGGGVELPLGLLGELGAVGTGEFLLRRVGRRLLARRKPVAALPRRATAPWFSNRETAAAAGLPRHGIVFPQGTCASVEAVGSSGTRTRDLVFIGRLIPWKAGRLAVRTLRHLRNRDVVLHFYGEGPDRQRLERAARRWGLHDRVVFEGRRPRAEVHARLSRAGVLLHPALHDESPLTVAEALSLGTPVVCLAHGGPRELVGRWPTSPSATVPPSRPEATARGLAAAVDRFLDDPPPVPLAPLAPTPTFVQTLEEAYQQAMRSDVST